MFRKSVNDWTLFVFADMELSDSKEESSKMTFDKESSLMVDLLLDDMDYEDETSAKLHAYVTGESAKPPPPPEQILFESGLPTSSLNGTLDMANSMFVFLSVSCFQETFFL